MSKSSRVTRVYISGPISGYDIVERRRFFAAAARRWNRKRGYSAVNPMVLKFNRDEAGPSGRRDWAFYLAKDIPLLCTCQEIAMQPGWRDSRGANLELSIAKSLGMKVHYEDSHEDPGSYPEISEDDTNPKDKIGSKKPNLALIPPVAAVHQAVALQFGADKYGPFNWRSKKIHAMQYIAAAQRHLTAWVDGEDNADDSGLNHLAHVLAGIDILLDAKENGMLIDDRPVVPGQGARVLKEYTRS